MDIKIINKSKHELPAYETALSAGMDLRANLTNNKKITLDAGERALIPTGIYIQLPEGYEAQIRPRSGLAYKKGITVLNSPGTIDADYTGGIGIILINHSKETFEINDGDRIAQMVIAKVEKAEWVTVKTFTATERGDGGFGHTGNN